MDKGVTRITFEHRLWVLVSSDWHWDSIYCNRDRLKEDLDLAKKYNAAVLSLGDFFDAMGGKMDPRSNGKYDIRQEFQAGNYFDEVVKQGADWLKPWQDQMAIVSLGNHETAVRKRQETCLTTRLVERLRFAGARCRQGGYAGWILFRGFKGQKTSSGAARVAMQAGFCFADLRGRKQAASTKCTTTTGLVVVGMSLVACQPTRGIWSMWMQMRLWPGTFTSGRWWRCRGSGSPPTEYRRSSRSIWCDPAPTRIPI
jgi:hypothetical protein